MSKPHQGTKVTFENGKWVVPIHPLIPYIEGDGSGVDIWRTARPVIDTAVEAAYQGQRSIVWKEVFAGQKAFDTEGSWLPEETLLAFREYLVGIKGPLATPVGEGMRSLNVALRKNLDLFACLRPVRWFEGVPAPVLHPEYLDVVIFRENTEDLYSGIEFEAGSEKARQFLTSFKEQFPEEAQKIRFPESSAFGIKPVSQEGSKRLVRAAINYAIANKRKSVTLVHKGNIMKFTEGGFRGWGYDTAEQEFGSQVFSMRHFEKIKNTEGEAAAVKAREDAAKQGKLLVKDIITDAAFEQTLTRPRDFDVLATTNLNGDYLSDALAAQVGGIGMAPGANINFESGHAIFEATHGTAPTLAGKDIANPGSVLLSAEMMLRYLGWPEAADLLLNGLLGAIKSRQLTADLHQLLPGSKAVSTSEFGRIIIQSMHRQGV
ncbi:MAG: NADP-dependent isocitrate dehydrogenase [Anaerolineaceae bacterium]